MIASSDEQLHPPDSDPSWQESFYFNWADPEGRYFGLARIGVNPAAASTDGLLVTMRDGRLEYVYPGVGLPWNPGTPHPPERGLTAGALTFTMREPLTRWHIGLESRRSSVDLNWTAVTGPHDFTGHSGTLGAAHFEQAGTVTGRICLRGNSYDVQGWGQRDKSWGVRDWATIDGWEWISGIFGSDFGFNATVTHSGGVDTPAGFVHRDGVNRALVRAEVDHTWAGTEHVPGATRLLLVDEDGESYAVTATALAQVPLVKKALFIQETHAHFECHVGGVRRAGVGVVEHAWHAGRRDLLRRGPDLLPVLGRALRGRW